MPICVPHRMVETRQKVDRYRVAGNAAYKDQDYATACSCYEAGLELDGANVALHANAAMALLKLNRYKEAVRHCDQVFDVCTYANAVDGKHGHPNLWCQLPTLIAELFVHSVCGT